MRAADHSRHIKRDKQLEARVRRRSRIIRVLHLLLHIRIHADVQRKCIYAVRGRQLDISLPVVKRIRGRVPDHVVREDVFAGAVTAGDR